MSCRLPSIAILPHEAVMEALCLFVTENKGRWESGSCFLCYEYCSLNNTSSFLELFYHHHQSSRFFYSSEIPFMGVLGCFSLPVCNFITACQFCWQVVSMYYYWIFPELVVFLVIFKYLDLFCGRTACILTVLIKYISLLPFICQFRVAWPFCYSKLLPPGPSVTPNQAWRGLSKSVVTGECELQGC